MAPKNPPQQKEIKTKKDIKHYTTLKRFQQEVSNAADEVKLRETFSKYKPKVGDECFYYNICANGFLNHCKTKLGESDGVKIIQLLNEALEFSKKAVEILSNSISYVQTVSVILQYLGKYEECIQCCDYGLGIKEPVDPMLSELINNNFLRDGSTCTSRIKHMKDALEKRRGEIVKVLKNEKEHESLEYRKTVLKFKENLFAAVDSKDEGKVLNLIKDHMSEFRKDGYFFKISCTAMMVLGTSHVKGSPESNFLLESAVKLCKKATELSPTSLSYMYTYCSLLYDMKNYPEAIVCCDKALEIVNPLDPSADDFDYGGLGADYETRIQSLKHLVEDRKASVVLEWNEERLKKVLLGYSAINVRKVEELMAGYDLTVETLEQFGLSNEYLDKMRLLYQEKALCWASRGIQYRFSKDEKKEEEEEKDFIRQLEGDRERWPWLETEGWWWGKNRRS